MKKLFIIIAIAIMIAEAVVVRQLTFKSIEVTSIDLERKEVTLTLPGPMTEYGQADPLEEGVFCWN